MLSILPSEFTKISNCEAAQEAWQILETTYKDTNLLNLPNFKC
jgi:hypothetical protein